MMQIEIHSAVQFPKEPLDQLVLNLEQPSPNMFTMRYVSGSGKTRASSASELQPAPGLGSIPLFAGDLGLKAFQQVNGDSLVPSR
jgi:hypothetical protein